MRTFPILFLHDLGCGHFCNGSFFQRGLNPELELCCRGKLNVFYLVAVNAFNTGDFRILFEKIEKFLFDKSKRVGKNGTRTDAFALVHEKRGDAERADRLSRLFVVMFHIVVNKPIDRRINRHIDLCIVQCCNARQDNRRSISLDCSTRIKVIDIFQENLHWNFLIRVVSCHVNADQRNKLDFRMCLHEFQYIIFRRVSRNDIEKFIHRKTPFLS